MCLGSSFKLRAFDIMDAPKEEEIEIGSSAESFQKFLNSQKEVFYNQIGELQKVVVKQCKLTGVNPLAQEMAAGALSIKIGKRPRDLLNPKAVKYMQAVFSIKDAISKKESREISALFGITVTQVRDFFTSQRTRVRKQVRLSREKTTKTNDINEFQDLLPTTSASLMDSDPVPLNSLPSITAPAVHVEPVPLNSVVPSNTEEALSTSTQDDIPPDLDDADRNFVMNIFFRMRKEETFSGQVKLMDHILQLQNPLVLIWFLTKGGVMIITTWLSQAVVEEQTSVISVILKVLCHLPLHKALPEHMSVILHSVNQLRFYHASDISNRARVLLSRWSKLFAKIQAMKKSNGTKSTSDSHSQMLLKQSIVEIMGDDANSEELLGSSNGSKERIRRLDSSQTPRLLLASADDSARKHVLGASSSYNKERRKVQLVEQPGQRAASRSTHATRVVTVNQGRPMSADDIQKAKIRALHMQSKYGKKDSAPNHNSETKSEGPSRPLTAPHSNISPASISLVCPRPEENNKPSAVLLKTLTKREVLERKTKMNSRESFSENGTRNHIRWQMPAEIQLNKLWSVGTGENSKEIDVQINRNRREKETIYQSLSDIPLNPKEPWDREMDYDDTLTPEIPTDQPPETDANEANNAETQVSLKERLNTTVSSVPSSSQTGSSTSTTEPDLELLAVLLKNPELVFALTSGQAGNLSREQTAKLLDVIKTSGAGLPGNLSEPAKKVEETVEVSLPSPTPTSNPGTSGWKPEGLRNPFSQQNVMSNRVVNMSHPVPLSTPASQMMSVIPNNSRISRMPMQQPNPHHFPSSLPNYQQSLHIQQPTRLDSPVHAPSFQSRPQPQGSYNPDSWRSRQTLASNSYYNQADQNSGLYRGPVQGQSLAGPPREENRYRGNQGFESWSPENSPSRNLPEQLGRGYRPRQQNSPAYWEHNRQGDGRWRDRRQ